jgi:hypothetical protein
MPRPLRLSHLPLEINNTNMKRLQLPGEPLMVACIYNVGNLSRFRYRGRSNKVFLFEYSKAHACHVLKIPHTIWHQDKQSVARELLDQGAKNPIVILTELPAEQAAKLAKSVPAAPARPTEPPVRLPRHLRRLPQYIGAKITKDEKGNLLADGKKVDLSGGPQAPVPQDQSKVVAEVLATKVTASGEVIPDKGHPDRAPAPEPAKPKVAEANPKPKPTPPRKGKAKKGK